MSKKFLYSHLEVLAAPEEVLALVWTQVHYC